MLFNSFQFLLFLPIVFCLYWFVFNKSLRAQNLLIVVVSYIFYGWWDWRFLFLMAFTSLWAWLFGLLDTKYERGRKFRLAVSLIINLGILGYFKYFNFFVDQAIALLNSLGVQANPISLKIILPVGISFYTFQALSYTIDVHRKQIEPTKDPIAFLAYVSFFPQLVAGPIERATNLLPQFLSPRSFNYAAATDGCRQMLWGFIKKMVIADNCAILANTVLNNSQRYSGGSIFIGLVFFSIQIYCDFSGYSDIAIGCSRLFGINIMRNFAYPYFSRDIAEFWRRWHISLTTWFRDYIYIPLGGSRCGKLKQIRNIFIIFIVSGFWHGANWTFIAWGAFHALCFLPLLLREKNRKYTDTVAEGRFLPSIRELFQMASTFFITVIGWAFFRAPDITTAISWITSSFNILDPEYFILIRPNRFLLPYLAVFIITEWMARNRMHGLSITTKIPSRPMRWTIYIALIIVCIGNFTAIHQQSFIYFQF